MSQKFKSEVELQALNNATTDTDKFLVSDSGVVKYRTGSQLLSDLGVSGLYVPYTGATGNVDLGTHTLSSYNLIVNHTSGSGVAASITKGGSGEALTINKTSGSGNAMSVTGGLTSLVNLTLSSIPNATIDTDRFIVSDGGAIKYRTGAEVLSDIGGQPALTNPITGTGTTNYVSKFTGTTTLGNSQIFDNGTNVGIGTTSLSNARFVVSGNSASGAIMSVDTSSTTSFVRLLGDIASQNLFNWQNGTDLRFATSNQDYSSFAERMRITSSGNVGIGTSSPGVKFVNSGGGNASGPTLGSGTVGSQALLAGNGLYGMYSGVSNNGDVWHQVQRNDWNTTVYNLLFQPSGGNVGIGTTTPQSPLQVGNYAFSGGYARGTVATFAGAWSSTLPTLTLISTDTTSTQNKGGSIAFAGGSEAGSTPYTFAQIKGLKELTGGTYSGYMAFYTTPAGSDANTERMRITSAGNVGIGTSSPNDKFHVVGGIYSTALTTPLDGNIGAIQIGYDGTNGRIRTWNSSPLIYSAFNYQSWETMGSERMRILAGGNVGIGTSSPVRELQVGGFSGNPEICIGSGTSGNGTIAFGDGASGNDPWRGYVQYQHSTDRMVLGTANAGWLTLTSGGALGLNIVPTNTAGRFEASNDIVAFSSSDKNWKKNIKNIDSPLEKLSQINGVEFDWIEDEPVHGNKGNDIGVIAQEIEQVLPQIVQTRESGMKAVQYDKIIPLLIESIKEQQKQIEELKQIINAITK